MIGRIELRGGTVSASLPVGGYMDAASADSGALAGFEFAVSVARVNDSGSNGGTHGPLVLTCDCNAETMRRLGELLLVKGSGAGPDDLRAIYSAASAHLRSLYADQPSPHATKDNAQRLAIIAESLHSRVQG